MNLWYIIAIVCKYSTSNDNDNDKRYNKIEKVVDKEKGGWYISITKLCIEGQYINTHESIHKAYNAPR